MPNKLDLQPVLDLEPVDDRNILPLEEVQKQNDFAYNNMQKADSTPDEMKRIYDASYWLGISSDTAINDTKAVIPSMSALDLTVGQKIKRWFAGEGEDYTPIGIQEQVDYWTKKIGRPVVRTFLKHSFGRMLQTPDVGFAILKKSMPDLFNEDNEYSNLTLEQAMDRAMDYNPSGFVKSIGDISEFIGGYKTASAMLKPNIPQGTAIKYRIPSVWQKANMASLTAGLSKTGRELSKFTADQIDPSTDYQYEGALGVLKDMGIMYGFSVASSLAGFGLSKVADTTIGKNIVEAYDKAILDFTKNYPKFADKIRPLPIEEYQNKANEWIKNRTNITPENFTPEQELMSRHFAREWQKNDFRTWNNYVKNPTVDIVYAKEKPADIQIKGFLPNTVSPIEPVMPPMQTDLEKTSQSATIPAMTEKQAARDNISPQDTAEAGKGIDTKIYKEGDSVKTGEAVTLTYVTSKTKRPNMGKRFAQDIEPKGEYMNYSSLKFEPPANSETGNITFQNPLVIEHKTTTHGGWKTDLSSMYGGKKGTKLTEAIKADGYDGIITTSQVQNQGKTVTITQEIINLNGTKQQSSFNPPAPDAGQLSPEQLTQGEKPVELPEMQRKRLIKETTENIQNNDIYLTEINAIEQQTLEIDVGTYYVPKNLRGEVEGIVGKGRKTALQRMFTFDSAVGAIDWSLAARDYEAGKEIDIGEFVSRVKNAYESKQTKGKLNIEALDKARRSGDIGIELEANKLEWLQNGLTTNEINNNIIKWAKDYDISENDIQGELITSEAGIELSSSEQADVIQQEKKMRSKIAILAANKGMAQSALSDLKLKYGGQRKLIGKRKNIGLDKLDDIYEAIKKIRPKRVDYKQVITKKTEKQIDTLKNNLFVKGQMTDVAWQDILNRETKGIEPKYINAKKFITQPQGRAILRRIHNIATLLKLTNGYEAALNNDPDLRNIVNNLNKTIYIEPDPKDPHFLQSMRYYSMNMQKKTGAPFYQVFQALTDIHSENHMSLMAEMQQLKTAVGEDIYEKIVKDEVSLKRVADYIDSKSHLENKPESPKDITDSERKVAQVIENILKNRELDARIGKFLRWYEMEMPLAGDGAIADFQPNEKSIRKAVDIYDTQGLDELVEYLKTQTWGVIKSGYDPKEMILRKIQQYKIPMRAIGKSHIKISESIEYQPQEKNIIQRLASYLKQMNNITRMLPMINAFVQLAEDNADKFDNWENSSKKVLGVNVPVSGVKTNIELYLNELKGYNIDTHPLMIWANKIYSQIAQSVLENSPTIFLYNLFEELAFSPDKTLSFVAKTEGFELTPEDEAYLETYVQQQRALMEEFYLINEEPLFEWLKPLNELAKYISLTSHSDVASRTMGFYGKMYQIKQAFKNAETPEQMMSLAKFDDFQPIEQKQAIAILAKDGMDAMARYLARCYVANTHFLYSRSQRSPVEMGSIGKVGGNLLLFPRAYTEKLVNAAKVVMDDKATDEARLRNSKIIVATIVGGIVVGSVISKITGIDTNPYNPLNIINFRFGGLYSGGLNTLADLYSATTELAYADGKRRNQLLNQIAVLIPKTAGLLIPFYNHTIRTLEAVADTKYIDRQILRRIREVLDEDYKMRPNAYKFNDKGLINKMQYVIFGRMADKKEENKKGNTGVTRIIEN